MKKLSPKPFLTSSYGVFDLCPKCENVLQAPTMQLTDRGYQLIYQCPDCASSFALVPFTELRLFEVVAETVPQ